MGREIRMVPPGWEHPRDGLGNYQPLFDCSYRQAVDAYLPGGDDGDEPPDQADYRPDWLDGEATYVQMYETVSEGTPVSPVFALREQLEDWLVTKGHSRDAARAFCASGWAPSMVMGPAGFGAGVDAHDVMKGRTPRPGDFKS